VKRFMTARYVAFELVFFHLATGGRARQFSDTLNI